MSQSLNISEIQLFNLLKIKLGEKEAEQLMNFVKSEVEHSSETKYEYINKDIKALKEELYRSFATKEDLINLRGGLEVKIAQMESKLILWAFVFWATQLAAIFAFLKFL